MFAFSVNVFEKNVGLEKKVVMEKDRDCLPQTEVVVFILLSFLICFIFLYFILSGNIGFVIG